MNEFEISLKWSQQMRDKLLRPFYKEISREGDVVFVDGESPICKILQRVLHADTLIARTDGSMISIDEKIRSKVYDDFLIEINSCTRRGHESNGWFYETKADVVLIAFVHGDERGALCFPLVMQSFKPWFEFHKTEFLEQMVRNPINGIDMWTRNLKVPRRWACQDLKLEGFNLRDGRFVEDFWGKPRMNWLEEYDAEHDFAKSIDECYSTIRERKAKGGKGWTR